MELWIPITIAAAFCQNLRSALQKHLSSATLSTIGATSVRFFYAVPFAVMYLVVLNVGFGQSLPTPNFAFAFYVVLVAVSQIVATALLLYLFAKRNFAVGTTYSKTETIQTAVFGAVILGDTVGWLALLAVLVSVAGVMLMSAARSDSPAKQMLVGWTRREALIGLGSGAGFAVAAVSVRGATLSLPGDSFVAKAAFALVAVTIVQSTLMSIYLRWREPGELTRVVRAWRLAGAVGLFGMLASACWFSAMTLQNVAYVRALGQIELVFTFVASYFIFREPSNRWEVIGILLVIGGIILLLLGR